MLNVDIIYSGDMYAPNGASVLIKCINDAENDFARCGVKQRIISPKSIYARPDTPDYIIKRKVSPFKQFVRKVSKNSFILSCFRYHRNLIRPAKMALDIYDRLQDKGEVVVFHERWTCYTYLKRHKTSFPKVILIIHGDWDFWRSTEIDMPRFKSKVLQPYKNKVQKTILEGCYCIGFDADLPRKSFCSAFNYDENKTFFVYNGIEPRLCPTMCLGEKLRIICVATLSERKNQMGILNAVGSLSDEYQNKIEVILVGNGPTKSELENKANTILSSVIFAGTQSEEQYYQLLKQSNCFCLFSKEEGLPIAVIESMRAGLPVLGSRVGGIPEEVIEGESGFVVDLDIIELSKRIQWMVDNLDKLPEMGRKSYELFSKSFTTEAMVKKYVEAYKN